MMSILPVQYCVPCFKGCIEFQNEADAERFVVANQAPMAKEYPRPSENLTESQRISKRPIWWSTVGACHLHTAPANSPREAGRGAAGP